MPAELISEQLVIFLLVLVASFIVSNGVLALDGLLEAQSRVVGQQALGYFFDLVGYSWVDKVDVVVAAPVGTWWIQASGTTLTIDVNSTIYFEDYPFHVYSGNITGPTCLYIEYTSSGVAIRGTQQVVCSWQVS
jgi:hypothetical protein